MAWGWLLGQQVMQSHNVGLTVCTLKAVTGYPCPSCGTTRSASALIAGRWQEGLYANPLGGSSFSVAYYYDFVVVVRCLSVAQHPATSL